MTVWRVQDWTWRLTALVGLGAPLGIYALAVGFIGACAPVLRDPDGPMWDPQLTALFLEYAWLPVLLWLLMLAWRHMALLWGLLWGLLGMGVVAIVTAQATSAGALAHAAVELEFAFAVATLASSQIWLAVQALAPRAPVFTVDDGVPGCAAPSLRRRARLLWVVVSVGGLIGLADALAYSLYWLAPLMLIPWPKWAYYVSLCIGLTLVGAAFVLLWRELLLSGRTWLWWLITWALCVPVVAALFPLVTVDFETLHITFPLNRWEIRELAEAACFAVFFLLLVPAQIWAALQARQLAPRRDRGN